VPGSGAEISVHANHDAAHGWIFVEVAAGGVVRFVAALTFFAISRASPALVEFLGPVGLAQPNRAPTYLLHDLTTAGRPIANIEVQVTSAVDRVGVHAILGSDFLRHFTEIRLDLTTSTLTLVDP
jgi:hypothetical protein